MLPFTTDDLIVLPSSTSEDEDTGNDVLTYPEPQDGLPARGSIQPQSSTEDTSGRDQVITTARVFLDGDVPLKATDRVLAGDVLVEVDGTPERWPSLLDHGHVEANAKYVTG